MYDCMNEKVIYFFSVLYKKLERNGSNNYNVQYTQTMSSDISKKICMNIINCHLNHVKI